MIGWIDPPTIVADQVIHDRILKGGAEVDQIVASGDTRTMADDDPDATH